MTMTHIQARMARTLLQLSGAEIANMIGVTKAPLHKFEVNGAGLSLPKREMLQKIYESKGVEFLEYDGVRPRPKSEVLNLTGAEGFQVFMRDVMEVASTQGGNICVSGVNERDFEKWQGDFSKEYLSTMSEIQKETPFTFQILVEETDTYFTASTYAEYKRVPSQHFSATPFYVYGDRLAMILFEEDDVTIYIIQSDKLADAQRKNFLKVWENLS